MAQFYKREAVDKLLGDIDNKLGNLLDSVEDNPKLTKLIEKLQDKCQSEIKVIEKA